MAGAFARRMMGTALPAAGERPLALRSLIAPRERVVEWMGDDLNPVFMLRGKELVPPPHIPWHCLGAGPGRARMLQGFALTPRCESDTHLARSSHALVGRHIKCCYGGAIVPLSVNGPFLVSDRASTMALCIYTNR
jgi:hypothetical protein